MPVEDDVDDVGGPPWPALTQEELRPVVVERRVEGGVALLVDGPAGEGARRLADVALGVAAVVPEREELHELAAVVLVRLALVVGVAVEPDEHRGVDGDRLAERPEVAGGLAAQQPVLADHQPRLAHLDVAGGEVAVPVEGQLLLERVLGRRHALQPPALIRLQGGRVVGIVRRGDLLEGQHLEVVGTAVGSGEAEQVVDGGGVPGRRPLLDLRDGGAEAGAGEEPRDPAEVVGRDRRRRRRGAGCGQRRPGSRVEHPPQQRLEPRQPQRVQGLPEQGHKRIGHAQPPRCPAHHPDAPPLSIPGG